jgi:hypothetical protein
MIIENLNKLKEVRKELKNIGYNIKTNKNSLCMFGEITKNNKSIYFDEIGRNNKHFEEHKNLYEFMEKFKIKKTGNYII